MRRFWMRSLTGQLIGLMLLALVLSQGVFFFINRSEQVRSLREVRRDDFLSRAAAVARLIASTDPARHPEVIRAASTSLARYWLTHEAPDDTSAWQRTARSNLLRSLPLRYPPATELEGDAEPYVANPRFAEADLRMLPKAKWDELPSEAWSAGRPGRLLELGPWNGFGLAVQIQPDLWLNIVYAKPDLISQPPSHYYITVGVTAMLLTLVSVLAVRRIGRPLQRLAESAERFGRGEALEPVPEEGADDIRLTAAAFNRMQSRIRRFVEDRTRMLAAISHDLRTPITSLRLRAEFIDDTETREKLIATLDEMQAMTEAALTFAREESTVEPTRTIDLDALIESVCDDLAEMGWAVHFANGGRIPWRCRPDSVRRALRNLIENAVRYGERAHVRVETAAEWLEIVVEDEGPGIPEQEFERVFAPFVRLETSRNRSTGGVGLGLAIARTIARSHGGDILLGNRADGGLRASLRLPRA